ncbi:hypothetical protein PSHT_08372 [Puccinia striiformis]|uniref:Secreted protein n=1 Tax=Puccinia striiformis TaxID=27350 RepID=A0A2S4VPG5_9BASI|nr:hypothetical protein PSHT_08372 [Puccinia striiformis]
MNLSSFNQSIMFSAKFITILTLAFLAINAVAAATAPVKRSQCSQWKLKNKHPMGSSDDSPMIIARVMTSKNSKQTLQTRANKTPPPITPPGGTGKDFGSDSESACPSGAYNTNTQPGTCLWTGEAQSPPYTSTKFYAGWLNGLILINASRELTYFKSDNQENCAKTIKLKQKSGKEVDAPVIDGCRFADDGTTISEAVGCSTVWVTDYTFKQLGGKPGTHTVEIANWDFAKGGN